MRLSARMLILCAAGVSILRAGDFSFTGTFGADDQVQLFDFSLDATATVTFRSLGYAGGTNAAGTPISSGGFDSYLTWYQASDGSPIGSNDNGPCGTVGEANGACLDAFFSGTLAAGNYVLALTQSGNVPNGYLSDGFSQQGTGNFTCPQGFCDSFGGLDNGNWAVDILNVTSASSPVAPEPSTASLALCGFALASLFGAIRGRTPAASVDISS